MDNFKSDDLLNNEENNDEIKKKRMIRILIIVLVILVLAAVAVTLVFVLKDKGKDDKSKKDTTDDPQQVPDNYIDLEGNEGELEKEFAKMGEFKVLNEKIQINQNQKYNYTMFYPNIIQVSESNEAKYPIIIFINNIGKTYKINQPIFEHLASYGFIIFANDDKNSLNGDSTEEMLENLENLNKNENFKFFGKLDLDNIGVSCQDKSIISLLKIANNTSLSKKIKSVFCASPLSQKDILLEKQYYFYKNMTFKNIFFISASNDTKFDTVHRYYDIIMVTPRNTYQNAIAARRNLTTRDNVLWKADSYHTAWYLYTLKNDAKAYKIFNGESKEILKNPLWKNTKIRSEEQILKGSDAIYVTDNFRAHVIVEENLEKKYYNKGNKEIKTYEYLCDPNLDKCAKNDFYNYIIYYPSELIENNKKYPLIVISNALNFGYFYITPILEHLASWGFVVIANDEGESYKSIGIRESLKIILELNKDEKNIFHNKIDLDNIGFSGHSAGAAGILYYTNFEYTDELKNISIKSLFPSCMNKVPLIKDFFRINIDFTKVNIPYIFVTSSEDEFRTMPDSEFKRDVLVHLKNNIYQFFARKNGTEHHNSYWSTIGYQTAWFLYTLTNEEDVKQIFEPRPDNETCPTESENVNIICSNQLWSHIIYCNKTSI